jgi:hypothetical protein
LPGAATTASVKPNPTAAAWNTRDVRIMATSRRTTGPRRLARPRGDPCPGARAVAGQYVASRSGIPGIKVGSGRVGVSGGADREGAFPGGVG